MEIQEAAGHLIVIGTIYYHIKVVTNAFDHDLNRLASSTRNNTIFRHCGLHNFISQQ